MLAHHLLAFIQSLSTFPCPDGWGTYARSDTAAGFFPSVLVSMRLDNIHTTYRPIEHGELPGETRLFCFVFYVQAAGSKAAEAAAAEAAAVGKALGLSAIDTAQIARIAGRGMWKIWGNGSEASHFSYRFWSVKLICLLSTFVKNNKCFVGEGEEMLTSNSKRRVESVPATNQTKSVLWRVGYSLIEGWLERIRFSFWGSCIKQNDIGLEEVIPCHGDWEFVVCSHFVDYGQILLGSAPMMLPLRLAWLLWRLGPFIWIQKSSELVKTWD